jgi:hypothetical protein
MDIIPLIKSILFMRKRSGALANAAVLVATSDIVLNVLEDMFL